MNRGRIQDIIIGMALGLVFAATINAPIVFFDKITMTDDLAVHYRWSSQFYDSLRQGYPYPRWMPREHDGFGESTFVYYAPLYFYLVSAFRAFGLDNWSAMKAVALVTNALAGCLAFLFCRRWASRAWAILGAFAVQSAPLPFHLLHFQSLIPFQAALPFYVWVLGTAFGHVGSPRYIYLPLSISLAALTAIHILSGYMMLACLTPCMLVLALRNRAADGVRLAVGWALSVTLGLCLAAIYLVPALTSWSLIDLTQWFEPIYSDWRNSFGFPLLTLHRYGMRWFSVQWLIGAAALVPAVCLAFIGWRIRRELGERRTVWLGLLILAGIALLFSSEWSYPLWATVEYFRSVAFPYRYFMLAATAGLMGLAVIGDAGGASGRKTGMRLLAAGAILCSVSLTAIYFYKIMRTGMSPEFDPVTLSTRHPHHVMNYFRTKGRGEEWRAYQEAGGFSHQLADKGVQLLEETVRSQDRVMLIEAPAAADVILPVDAYPAWSVTLDGQAAEHWIDGHTGLLRVHIPAGRHRVHVTWTGLPQERIGRWISAGALLLMGFYSITTRCKRVGAVGG